MERRWIETAEVRAQGEEGKPRQLTGYAALFNTPVDFGRFREQIAPSAFTRSIDKGDVVALWNHNPDFPLGRQSNGTLRLTADDRGLRFQLDLPETQAGRDVAASVARGDVSGMSFGFNVPAGGDEWRTDAGGKKTRTLLNVDMRDVSPVTFPAYEQTLVEARSLEAIAEEGERRLAAAPAPDRDLAERQDRTRLARLT